MMTQAFYTGISGLKTNSTGIDIMANNLANISTVGYKGNGYEFASLFENTISTPDVNSSVNSSVGVGSRLQASPLMFQKGSPMLSDKSTDLALFDDGWFGIQGNGKTLYTRDGSFTFDKNDDLVTQDGFYVLGTMGGNISADNVLTSQLPEIKLGDVTAQQKLSFPKFLTFPPEPSSHAKFYGNLGTDAGIKAMSAGVVDPQSNKNDLRLEFSLAAVQTPPGTQWDVTATTKSLDGTKIYDTKTGQISFDSAGALVSSTLSSIDNNGATVTIDLGSAFGGVTAISNIPVTASSLADGTVGGDLRGYDINKNGEVVATFTNGMQSSVGKIAVYHFQNDQGLERINGSRFAESADSGKPIFFKDANGENIIGTEITNFKLEGSNIDMSYGLTELIILQRAYDANSKSVTTADQMIQKALNMDA
jgi:flagellar hook protein FlgE